MSYGTLRVTHTMWGREQWEEHCEVLADLWDDNDEVSRKTLIGDLVAHSGDLAYTERDETPIAYIEDNRKV